MSSIETPQNTAARMRVVIAGGGVAALEAALALHELAAELTDVTVIAPNHEFVNRPERVREPFAGAEAEHRPLAPIVMDAGASLLTGELAWVDPQARIVHTRGGTEVPYDALLVALGAQLTPRYGNAVTIDDRHLDATLHGLVQDVEGGYLHRIAFVAPPRMPWPLPLYELALMTAGRAYDMGVDVEISLVTPEEAPLAIFGEAASMAVARRLADAGVETITSAYAEIPHVGEIHVRPGDRVVEVERVVALPELYGPSVRGLPVSTHGFLRVDSHCRVLEVERVWAAGDALDFGIKHGGLASQQADAAARSIAKLAGAAVSAAPFKPVIQAMLLTDGAPLYLSARITGGQGFSSEVSSEPPPLAAKITARYLTPYLAGEHAAVS